MVEGVELKLKDGKMTVSELHAKMIMKNFRDLTETTIQQSLDYISKLTKIQPIN